MNGLKHWAWTLLMAAGLLLFYFWLESPNFGPGLSQLENGELIALVLAIVCLLLAVTVWIIYKAFTQRRS